MIIGRCIVCPVLSAIDRPTLFITAVIVIPCKGIYIFRNERFFLFVSSIGVKWTDLRIENTF